MLQILVALRFARSVVPNHFRLSATPTATLSSNSKVPKLPTWEPVDTSNFKVPEISDELARYLERTSLVQFQCEEGIKKLHETIIYTSQIHSVDTEGVEPLYSIQDNEVYLREDVVKDESSREEILSQANKNVEDWYFIAPPGNIPLTQTTNGEKGNER